jgi:uncharacterized protein YecT (DUF1311 family)
MRITPRSATTITVAMLLVCLLANAQAPTAVSKYVDPAISVECQEDALALSRCEAARAENSGRYLAKLIRQVLSVLPEPERAPFFKKANDAWLKYRNASCDFDAEAAAGNSSAFRYASCTHSYNKARIALLEKYLSCLKGECSNDVQLYYLVSPP